MIGGTKTYKSAAPSLLAAFASLSSSTVTGQEVAVPVEEGVLAGLATDQRCSKGRDIRRIEIRFADEGSGLPCKVVYRPETESDTLGIVSWQDIDSVQACRARAEEVADRLSAEGWTCAEDQANVSREGAISRGSNEQATLLTTERVEDAAGAVDTEAGIKAVVNDGGLIPRAIVPTDDGDTVTAEEEDPPATLVDNPDLPAPPEELVALIEGDLARLDTTLDGVLEAQIAGYGDLNADDVDDALVLYTYMSPQPAYRQFLIAYVFDGETYQLTATRPVGSTSRATKAAKVDAIDRGVIHVTLEAFEPGDAACCPSGARRVAFALQDLELVEIDANAPTR